MTAGAEIGINLFSQQYLIENPRDIDSFAGIHGTSAQYLKRMLQSGEIRPVTEKTRALEEGKNPGVSFVPRLMAFNGHPLEKQIQPLSPEEELAEAMNWARSTSFFSHVNSRLPEAITGLYYAALFTPAAKTMMPQLKQMLWMQAMAHGCIILFEDFSGLIDEALNQTREVLVFFNLSVLELPLEVDTFGYEARIVGSEPLPFRDIVKSVYLINGADLQESF
jgi:hypothetical protein